MTILIIPGLIGHPGEVTFRQLGETLESEGHDVIKLAWPHLPDNLAKYSFTETIAAARQILTKLDPREVVILGFSMGGVIAAKLASEFQPAKLGLIVSPYQAGTEDDLAGKYKEWGETGYRELTSSVYGVLNIPFSFIEDAQKYNALDYIQNVVCPVLFIAGEKDDKVSPNATKKLFDAANEPKDWHLLPGMEHRYQYQSEEMLAEVNRLIVEFINKPTHPAN
jgi:esterase/lipase